MLTWLLKPGFARLMISSTNSLVLCKLQQFLGMERLFKKDLTMNSKFEPNLPFCLINYNFVDNFFTEMI